MPTSTRPPGRIFRGQQFWKATVDNWQASGLSQVAFCKQESLPIGTFSKWKTRFMGKELQETVPKKGKAAFIPVVINTSPADDLHKQGPIEVTLTNKLVVKIPLTLSPHHVVSIVEALSTVRC